MGQILNFFQIRFQSILSWGKSESPDHASAACRSADLPCIDATHWSYTTWEIKQQREQDMLYFYIFELQVTPKGTNPGLTFLLELIRSKKTKQGDLDYAREITAVWCGNVKKLNFLTAILFFYWRLSWIDNGYLISLYFIW